LAGEIVITNPRSDSSKAHDHALAAGRILFHGQKLNRVPSFAQRFRALFSVDMLGTDCCLP
jgi:hypothetical protein